MKISSTTKISDLIAHNKEAIEVIAAINPHFKKLRNPILRKLLAPRVTIADAAKIGKCNVSDFFNALKQIGFEISEAPKATENPNQSKIAQLAILEAIKAGDIRSLDVRPILEKDTDPFHTIMKVIEEVPDNHVLEIINTFEPTPLIGILSKRGYQSYIESKGETVHAYFIKIKEESSQVETTHLNYVPAHVLEEKKKEFNRIIELDVTQMEMPMPMVSILESLDQLHENEALFVFHRKVPQFLLPELKDRNFTLWISEVQENQVQLLVFK